MFDVDTRLDAATTKDFDALAALHGATLPTSTLGRLGTGTLVRYYRWVAASADECLFVSRVDAEVVAAAVVSVSPATILRRFIAHAPLAFGIAVAAAFLRSAPFRREAAAYARERLRSAEADGPELVQIFVNDRHQHRSLGSQLLARVERHLAQSGASGYHTRTVMADNERTLAFYRTRGFVLDRELMFCGERYALFTRTIPTGRTH